MAYGMLSADALDATRCALGLFRASVEVFWGRLDWKPAAVKHGSVQL